VDEVANGFALSDVQRLLDICREIDNQVAQLTDTRGIKVGGCPDPAFMRKLEDLLTADR
jgi:hypothetical protein